ncbi:MAG TPA: hypothetical protein VF400_10030 [Anaeromyxobacteraceae bacterium]
MTTELQRAMARYEEARIRYRKAVLASLNGASNGEAIREAIKSFQRANAELKRLTAPPPAPRAVRVLSDPSPEASPSAAWAYIRRVLSGVGSRMRLPASG